MIKIVGDDMKVENRECLPTLLDRWFKDGRHLGVSANLEGTKHDFKGRRITFGCRAGPNYDVTNLLHEMAHFIEIDERRVVKENWGFRIGRPFLTNFGVDSIPVNTKGTEREARVWAIQHLLTVHLGIEETVMDKAKIAQFMPDFWRIPGETYDEKIAFVVKLIEDGLQTFTLESIEGIWNERVAKLGALFDAEIARRKRADRLLAGEVRNKRKVTFADDEVGSSHVLITEDGIGDETIHEVAVIVQGDLVGDGYALYETEEAAEKYARSMFDGEPVKVTTIEPEPGLTVACP